MTDIVTPILAATVALWGPLNAGMTRAEVKAVRPSNVVRLADTCTGWLTTAYRGGKLVAVHVAAGAENGPGCRAAVRAYIAQRYGEPVATGYSDKVGPCLRLKRVVWCDPTIATRVTQWVGSGVRVTYSVPETGEWSIDVALEPRPVGVVSQEP